MNVSLRPGWVAAISYLMYSLAGTAFMFLPNDGLNEVLGWPGFLIWNLMLSFGGAVALIGALKKRAWIEMVGLPGVVVGLFVYSAYLASKINDYGEPGIVLGLSLICGGASVGGIGRAFELRSKIRTSERVRKEIEESGGA